MNPYQRLKQAGKDFARAVRQSENPKSSFWFQKNSDNFPANIIRERSIAAEQLDYELVVKVIDGEVHFHYRHKLPVTPFELM